MENPKLYSAGTQLRTSGYWKRKRLFDLVGAIILLFAFLPIFLLISITILITSGRPVFFRQIRTGKDFKPFTIYKFRTMAHSHSIGEEHVYNWDGKVPDHFVFKAKNDVRTTALGKLLRKYSLDELPQLFNVLIGEMSIIGPRPEIPAITKFYSRAQSERLSVKPGITGYAQINGRSDINHGEKIKYDLYYVKNCGFRTDFRIVCMTVVQVITGKGAY